MTTSVEARATLQGLETQAADLKRRLIEAEESIRQRWFAAHTGNSKAKQRLDELRGQETLAKQEAASLEIAITEGKQRLAAAIAAETDEHERNQARMALGLISGFIARGKSLDERLASFVAEFQELNRDFLELQKVNYPPATWALIATNMRSAMLARLMFTELQIEHLPPSRRHSFAQVIEAWGANVRSRAQSRLDRDGPAKTSEAA